MSTAFGRTVAAASVLICLTVGLNPVAAATDPATRAAAEAIINQSGVAGGVVVHIGCGDGNLTAALGREPRFLVHGLDTDAARVAAARRNVASLGVYGTVTVGRWDGARLPFADGLVSLVVAERMPAAPEAETMRVLAPLGVLMVRDGDSWQRRVKPWPEDIDEWTHYLHDATNNAVAQDTRIAPPRSLQWIGSPRWSRHHDRIAAMSNLVTAAGRLFYIFDEGPTSSVILPSKWSLIARDAFNGVVLWKRPIPDWQTRLWPLKSGPAQLPRRLVASEDTIFATLGIDVPLTAIDARTGDTLRTYEGTQGTEEILLSDGALFLLVDDELDTDKYTNAGAVSRPWWTGRPKRVMAVEAATGKVLWQHPSSVVPLTLAADDTRVFFHDGSELVCLNRADGAVQWTSDKAPLVSRLMSFFAPTLVVQDGVVLFAGGEESGLVKSTGGATKADTITAFDAETGGVLWSAEHLPSGYSSPEDVFVIDGAVWYAGVSNGGLPGAVIGRDLHSGEIVKSYDKADVETYWFHHRCYRGKATSKYLMVARTGTEFIDPKTGHWEINHWTRGGCLYGIMPANGLIYTPPHDCICYPEAKLFGFCALSAPRDGRHGRPSTASRLERGPAYDDYAAQDAPSAAPASDEWPTYRHDALRSGATPQAMDADLKETWRHKFGTRLSTVTIADGMAFVAEIDRHTVHALNAASGEPVWSYVVGGRVDSPPTIYKGAAIFGCADGWLYCLRATDGALIWRFRAAPEDSRIVAFEQLESPWPLHGSVLIQDGIVCAVAGRSVFLDGGLRLCRVDARTGKLVSEDVLDERDPKTGENIQAQTVRLTMPVGLPDVLSSDGKHLYMRSQVFDMEGKRLETAPHPGKLGAHADVQEGDTKHLFSPSGFLDGTWFHRSYWVYGRNFEGGWNGYYLAGRRTPTGKIMSFDGTHVYGYGREPKYLRWTTPMEFQLYAAPRQPPAPEDTPPEGTIVRVNKSKSLDPSNTPLTVTAWVRAERPDGVVIAHGGGVLGYSLFLKGGVPCFATTASSKRWQVEAREKAPDGWLHLAGVLRADGELQIYVNGALSGTTMGAKLIPKDPADALQIGADEGSFVGDYKTAAPFKGTIDETRVYHAELSGDTIGALASGAIQTAEDSASMVMYHKYDKGNASDFSDNKNHGTVVGAELAEGRFSGALLFTGILPDEPNTRVPYEWSMQVPLLARGMVSASGALFVAGPDDLVDEPTALNALDDPEVQQKLVEQEKAFAGDAGGLLRAVAPTDGTTLWELRLDTIPVWDGLAVAGGRLYLAGADGSVRCYSAK